MIIDKKKVYLKVWGCQMNESDSELVQTLLELEGFQFSDSAEKADIILLNTCAVREHAVRRVRGAVHEIRHKRKGRPALIGILGCVPTHLKQDLLKDKNLNVDLIAGPDSYRRLPQLINEFFSRRIPVADLDFDITESYEDIIPQRQPGVNAWVPIMRGCDNFCTFCVVPYTRGRERSRDSRSILKEIRRAVGDGYPQITLLGQNVNSYGFDSCDFSGLLEKISRIKGLKRIRFMSPHPKDFPDKLLKVMAAHDNICKHIHLPLQAGNTRVLKIMNRCYTQRDYLRLINKIRQVLPNTLLTTDIIVGFPTETDKEFLDTVAVIKKVRYDAAFIFKYSPRAGTLAAKKYQDDVHPEVKTERIVSLNQIQKQISLKKNQSRIGQTFDVMIESKTSARSTRQCTSRTDGNIIVILPKGAYRIGDILAARITGATPNVLQGRIPEDDL